MHNKYEYIYYISVYIYIIYIYHSLYSINLSLTLFERQSIRREWLARQKRELRKKKTKRGKKLLMQCTCSDQSSRGHMRSKKRHPSASSTYTKAFQRFNHVQFVKKLLKLHAHRNQLKIVKNIILYWQQRATRKVKLKRSPFKKIKREERHV